MGFGYLDFNMKNDDILHLIHEKVIDLVETTSSIKTTVDLMEKECKNKHCLLDKQMEEKESRIDGLEDEVKKVKTIAKVMAWMAGVIGGGAGLTYTVLQIVSFFK